MTSQAAFLLAIDQGATSTSVTLLDAGGSPLVSHSIELHQIYPANGWVEPAPDDIWEAVWACCRIVTRGVSARDITGLGITNQRLTHDASRFEVADIGQQPANPVRHAAYSATRHL
ncbi:MAG: hypothetical protein KGJ79_05675 [Alphaproteobacteria bacterium]|nr:hypothetical protein [Alphaproteobacteria bacterium]MDE2110610.1 hypothetical protein [Alphaproteobacteria bacterium]MDE2495039.1 hypothetical protein [Alphaproteobacteria bacterium]